jgi:TP901 family phage tail tape measure protein
MPGDFGTSYIIAITLENLAALKELRAELKALRDDSKKPIDFTVNVKPSTADNIGKVVEQKVAQGIDKGSRRSGSKGATGTAGSVAFDAASLKKFEDAAEKIAKAAAAMGKGLGDDKPLKIDAKDIAKQVGEAVAREVAKLPRGSGGGDTSTTTRDRVLTDERRRAIKKQASSLNEASITPKKYNTITELNSKEVQELLDKRAELLGGALQKQNAKLRRAIEAVEARATSGGESNFGVGEGASTAGLEDEINDARAKLFKVQQQLLKDSTRLITERITALDQTIARGAETVRVKQTSLSDIDKTLKRSMSKLEKSFSGFGETLVTQFAQFTDKLAASLATIQIQVPNIEQFVAQAQAKAQASTAQAAATVAAEAAPAAARADSSRRKRRINSAATTAATATAVVQQQRGAQPLDDSPEAAEEAVKVIGRRMLAQLRKQQAQRAKTGTSDIDKYEHEFFNMDPAKVRRIVEEARGYRVLYNERDRAVLRGTLGDQFGEDTPEGIRVRFGQARGTSRSIGQILPTLRRITKEKKLTPELRAEYAQLHRGEYTGPLLAGYDPESLNYSDVGPLAGKLKETRDVLVGGFKRASFARRDLDVPRWSPIQLQQTEALLRKKGTEMLKATQNALNELPATDQRAEFVQRRATLLRDLAKGGGLLQDADLLGQFRARATKNAVRLGYKFQPFGGAEQKAILDSMADAAGLKTGEAFGKKVGGYNPNNKGAAYNEPGAQHRLYERPDELLSRYLEFGGEWHTGDFQGFKHSVFQPEIRELPAPILHAAAGFGTLSGKNDPVADAIARSREAGEKLDPRTGRPYGTTPSSLDAELVNANVLRQRLRTLPEQRGILLNNLLATHQNIRTRFGLDYAQQFATSTSIRERSKTAESLLGSYSGAQAILANPGLRLASGGIATDPASIRESRRQAAATIRGLLGTAKSKFGASTPEQLQNAVAALPAPNDDLEQSVKLYAKQKKQYQELQAKIAETEAELKASVSRIESYSREKNVLGEKVVASFRQNINRFQRPIASDPVAAVAQAKAAASAAATAQIAAGVPVIGVGGGAGGGGKVPPGAPPGGTGGTGGSGGFGGPGDWRDFVSAMKALEHVRLTGLAEDLQGIAKNMRDAAVAAKQSPLLQSFLSAEKQKELVRVRGADRRTTNADAERLRAERDERQSRIRAETAARIEAIRTGEINQRRAFSSSLRRTVGGQVSQANAGILGALGSGGIQAQNFSGLASTFLADEGALGSTQRRFRRLLNRYGVEGLLGNPASGTVRGIRSAAIDQDALRASLVQTVSQATSFTGNPRFQEFGPLIQGYGNLASERLQMEKVLEKYQVNSARATNPNLSIEDRRQAATQSRQAYRQGIIDYGINNERQMGEAILHRRRAEDQLTQSLLSRASAEFRAFKQAESHKNLVERFTDKLKSFSMYVAGGALVYGTAALVQRTFSETAGFEKDLAHVQGIVGNRTPTERRAIERGVLDASIQYGVSPQEALNTAKIFAQTGIGTRATLTQTRSALAGQLGAGLEPQQATEMLIAVANITKGVVSSSDILDRISRVEAKFAVTAQDLSIAIQRVGSLAVQLQPQPVGRFDALDLVAGATTAQVERTRVSGNQAATALRFMLSRLTQPQVGRQLQDTFGIRLGSDKTELRPLVDILEDIAKLYQRLLATGQSGQAAQLLTTVSGGRQVNQAAALFGNWDDVVKVMNESSRAWGDTQRRVEIQMDTFGFQLDRAKASFFAFSNELLKTTGILTLFKAGAAGLGYLANNARGAAGFAPLAGGVAALGVASLATKAVPVLEAKVAQAAAGGVIAGGLGNLASLTKLISTAGFSLAWPLLIGGGIAGGATLINGALNKNQDQQLRFGPPDIDYEKIRQSDVYQAFKQRALANNQSPEGLQSAVVGAAASARASVLAGKFGVLGPDIFTTDEDHRRYRAGIAEETTKKFVDALARAVPEIGKIADESDRTAAALSLLKQASLVSQLVSGYTQSYQTDQFSNLSKELEESVTKAISSGVAPATLGSNGYRFGYGRARYGGTTQQSLEQYGFGLTKAAVGAGIGAPSDVIKGVFGNVFKELAPSILGLNITDLQGTESVAKKLAGRMEQAADSMTPLGKIFDDLARDAFELSFEQRELVESIRKGASGTYEQQRSTVLSALATTPGVVAQGARIKLANQEQLDDAIYNQLKSLFKGPKGALSGPEQTGGLAGSTVVFEAFQRASRRRIEDLRKSGLTGQAGELEAAAKAIEANQNRASEFLDFVGQKRSGRATARERILDVLLRYGQGEEGSLAGGQALRSAGVGVDIAQERVQNSQQLLRGLFEARAQLRGDMLRAAAKRGDLEPGTLDELNTDGERSALPRSLIQHVLANASPQQKEQLDAQVKIAKQALAAISSDKQLFSTLAPDERKQLFKLLNESGEELLLDFESLVALAKKFVSAREKELLAQQKELLLVQQRTALEAQQLESASALAQSGRALRIRGAETLYGPGTALPLRLADVTASAAAQRAAVEQRLRGQESALQKQVQQGTLGPGSALNEIFRLRGEADIEIKRITDTAERGRLEITGEYQIQLAQEARNFALRKAGVRGPNDEFLQRVKDLGPATLEFIQALDELSIAVLAQRRQLQEELTGGATQGIRDVLGGGFDNLRRLHARDDQGVRHLGEAILDPIANTLNHRVGDVLTDAVFGPHGLLGEQLGKLFNLNIFQEAEAIRRAHIEGILAGFRGAQSIGTGIPAVPDVRLTPSGFGRIGLVPSSQSVGPVPVGFSGVIPSVSTLTASSVSAATVAAVARIASDPAVVRAVAKPTATALSTAVLPPTIITADPGNAKRLAAVNITADPGNAKRLAAVHIAAQGNTPLTLPGVVVSPAQLPPVVVNASSSGGSTGTGLFPGITTRSMSSLLLKRGRDSTTGVPYYFGNSQFNFSQLSDLKRLGVSDPSRVYLNDDGFLVYDTTKDKGKNVNVPTHLLGGQSNRRPGESWEDYEARIKKELKGVPEPPANKSLSALDPTAQKAFTAMLARARKAGFDLNVQETYRSPDRQDWLFANSPGSTYTLTSAHSDGRAIDVGVGRGTTAEYQKFRDWLKKQPEGFKLLDEWDPGHIQLPRNSGVGYDELGLPRGLLSGKSVADLFGKGNGLNAFPGTVYGNVGRAPVADVPRLTGGLSDISNADAALGEEGVLSRLLAAGSPAVNDLARADEKKFAKQQALNALASLAGTYGGAAIGNNLAGSHKNYNYADLGASIGTIAGSFIPIPYVGPLIGGVLGGVLGGLFHKSKPTQTPEYSALEAIARNTRDTVTTIDNQTRSLLSLDNRLLNVPASFRVPQYSPIGSAGAGAFGTSGGSTFGDINITVHEASDARQTAALVVDQLRAELRGAGSYVSPRGTRQ